MCLSRPAVVRQRSEGGIDADLIVRARNKAGARNVFDQIVIGACDLSVNIRERRRHVVGNNRILNKGRSTSRGVLQEASTLCGRARNRVSGYGREIEVYCGGSSIIIDTSRKERGVAADGRVLEIGIGGTAGGCISIVQSAGHTCRRIGRMVAADRSEEHTS